MKEKNFDKYNQKYTKTDTKAQRKTINIDIITNIYSQRYTNTCKETHIHRCIHNHTLGKRK